MGAGQRPTPAMRGWGVELRGQSFRLYGPSEDATDPETGPLVKTEHGWWADPGHLHGLAAALELTEAALGRYWITVIRQRDAETPGSGSGPDRGVQLAWKRGPDDRPGPVFTDLPEHAWEYDRLQSLELTYTELDRLLGQAHVLHDACPCDRPRRGPVIPPDGLAAWHTAGHVLDVYNTVRLRLEHGRLGAPGARLPEAEQLADALDLTVRPEPGAAATALARLATEGRLRSAADPPGPPYWVPGTDAAPAPGGRRVQRTHRRGSQTGVVYRLVIERILSGAWPPGHRLPTYRHLADLCGTGGMAVQSAVIDLDEDGWVRRPGQGGRRGAVVLPPIERQESSS